MHTIVNVPPHGQNRLEVRPVVKEGGAVVELRVFDKEKDPKRWSDKVSEKDLGLGTGAELYLGFCTKGMDSAQRSILMQRVGEALCFVLRKGQEAGYNQAKGELLHWLHNGGRVV